MKDKNWNIMMYSIGGSLTLVLIVLGLMYNQDQPKIETTNPYVSSLITCHGSEVPFSPDNMSMAGIFKCDNGTLIRIHYMQIMNDSTLYAGTRLTP